ncbi:hypothetical protein ACROYT_G033310 [Oculina patagonica]
MDLCQVRLNPTNYGRMTDEITTKNQVVSYPTVRSDIRTFNIQGDQRRYECTNLFQGRIPNRVIVGMVLSTAFTWKEIWKTTLGGEDQWMHGQLQDEPKQAGNLLIELNFGANPGVNVTIIVYEEFENLLEIDKNKTVLYHVYQR